MITGEPLIIVCPVNANVAFNVLSELLTNLCEDGFFTGGSHHFVREVGVHT